MTREIKYRAWDKGEKEYYYDVEDTYDYRCGGRGCYADSFGEVLAHPERFEIEQYTGLKDKNGKMIYEGDIVEIDKYGKFQIIWNEWACKFDFDKIGKREREEPLLSQDWEQKAEVIGTIHENPELLKEGGKNGKSKV